MMSALLAGLAMAWAVNCKPPLIVFTLVVLAAAYRPISGSLGRLHKPTLLPGCLICLCVVLGVVAMKAYDAYKFPPGTDDPFAEYAKLYGPWITSNPFPALAGLALSPSCGAFWYCPTLILSLRGWGVWRQQYRWFCVAVLVASLWFVLGISFLPFFKGEPCWGPRYLTPMFAVLWVFVPSAIATVRLSTAKFILGLGLAVQLLGLTVDPVRLFVQIPLRWNYFNEHPWLVFDAQISHLIQRPREIVEVLTPQNEPAVEFNPAPLPTHAGAITTGAPFATTIVGMMPTTATPGPLNAAITFWPAVGLQQPLMTQNALRRYHVFNAPRPWVVSQWYLREETRPVDLVRTIAALLALASIGSLLMLGFGRGVVLTQQNCSTTR
jgi:hypothetical protein